MAPWVVVGSVMAAMVVGLLMLVAVSVILIRSVVQCEWGEPAVTTDQVASVEIEAPGVSAVDVDKVDVGAPGSGAGGGTGAGLDLASGGGLGAAATRFA